MEKIFILDISGYLFRSYHAIKNLTDSGGRSTNALYGFIRCVSKILREFHPTHLVAVFDGPENTKARRALYPEYKKNRLHPPEDLPHQFDLAYDFCRLAGIPSLRIPEQEADDVMASVALWAVGQGAVAYLCTSDKDLFQLVSPNIRILNTHKNNLIYGPEEVKEHFGVWPSQMLDYLSIIGDASDNIPGVKGFGEKTARSLLEQAGSLQKLLENPDAFLNENKKKTFLSQQESLKISRLLITLDTNVPIPQTEKDYLITPPSEAELKTFYRAMNFDSLLKEYFPDRTPAAPLPETIVIQDVALLDTVIKELSEQTEVCLDTETTGLRATEEEIIGLGLGYSEGKIWYLPLNDRLPKQEVLKKLKPLFDAPHIRFYGHNIKFDLHMLANEGITLRNIGDDTILMSYLLAPHLHRHSLDSLARHYLDHTKISFRELTGKKQNLKDIAVDQVAGYCGEDVWVTMRLKTLLESLLEEMGLVSLYKKVELPLISVLFEMERTGIYVDPSVLADLKQEIGSLLSETEKEIHHLAGENFNIKSPKQLAGILFEKLLIPPPKKNKSGFSTDAETLELLEQKHPIIEKILLFRMLDKLHSSYLESLIKNIQPKTGRIHCVFNQTATATGRLSCQEPNLQTIPVRTTLGSELRKAFRPSGENMLYLAADYSQIELRLLAHFSEDPTLLTAFQREEDIHAKCASQIFGVPLREVTSRQRSAAKSVNFGILYGQQAFGLSKQLKISKAEAEKFIKTYFEQYPKVKQYLESSVKKAEETGRAETFLHRIRPLPDILSKNKLLKGASDRLAINTPLQGTAADIIKLAMLRVHEGLPSKAPNTALILQIHDELLFELPCEEKVEAEAFIKQAMEHVVSLKVPLIVDIKIGKNWKEC